MQSIHAQLVPGMQPQDRLHAAALPQLATSTQIPHSHTAISAPTEAQHYAATPLPGQLTTALGRVLAEAEGQVLQGQHR